MVESTTSGAFYVIVDEEDGIYIVYKDPPSVELLSVEDVYGAAELLGIDIAGKDQAEVLYAVAAKIIPDDPNFLKQVAQFKALGTGFLVCLRLWRPLKVIVARGHR